MKDRRFAAIDIGTNSIRCIMVEIPPDSEFKVLDDEKATVRLGEGLAATGAISPAAWQRAREALVRMKKIAEGLGVHIVEAVATSAVRNASNGPAFVAAIEAETGIKIPPERPNSSPGGLSCRTASSVDSSRSPCDYTMLALRFSISERSERG